MKIPVLLLVLAAAGDSTASDPEIEFLLNAVGQSQCTFIRNGKSYPAEKAESHLRRKYKRGKRYASNAEQFIDRLASRSSMSGKEYSMQCGDQPGVSTESWFLDKLNEHRGSL